MNSRQVVLITFTATALAVLGALAFVSLTVQSPSTQTEPKPTNLDTGPQGSESNTLPPVDIPGYTKPTPSPGPSSIGSFGECVAAGNPVMESYPRQCRADGKTFVEPIESPVCPQDVKQCSDGSYVSRTGANCEFSTCPETSNQDIIECTTEQKAAEICTREYMPVCGQVEVQCFTEPCNPIPQTYSNACTACAQGNVNGYTVGACEG